LRIISGRWKSRRLISIKGSSNTRPTSDRVKEAVFNMLRDKLYESAVLDIFAGTGNMGFEALSRGSSKAVFIEKNRKAVSVIEKNARNLDCVSMIHIIKKDVFKAIDDLSKERDAFDIIFMDPPYNANIEKSVLLAILNADILDRQGVVVVEHDYKNEMPNNVEELIKIDTRKYGNTGISLYKKGDFK